MATVRAQGPAGEPTTLTVVARGDRVLVRVGNAKPVSLSPEQAAELLHALRGEFDRAASAQLNMCPPTGRPARPNPGAR